MHKVFVVTTVHGRYDVRIFLKQCRSLSSHSYDVTLVVQDGKGNEVREGVKIMDLGQPPKTRIMRIFFAPLRVFRVLRSLPADIFHFHDPELLPIGFFLKKAEYKIIYDSHEDYPRLILSKYWIHPVLRKTFAFMFELLEDYVAKRLDAIVCATPFIQNRFNRINPISINVNNFPIQNEFLSVNKEERLSRSICFPGTIKREYGINELLASLEILQDVSLILCGSFESQAYADELMSMSGWKFVVYRGIVGHDEVGRILASCAVGVVTLLPSRTNNDSLPIKMFEYMAAGLPVIASNFPLWKEIIEKNKCGICVNPSNPEEIADAINWIMQHPTEADVMGKNGQTAVLEKYNWEKESQKLINLYRKLPDN